MMNDVYLLHRILKKFRRKFCQVTPPNGPRVVAGGQLPLITDVFVLQRRNKLLVAALQKIVLATANPKQLKLRVSCSRISEHSLRDLLRRRSGAKGPNPRKTVEISEAHRQRLAAAHAQAGNRSIARFSVNTIDRLNQR